MSKEALKLALEALKYSDTVFYPRTSIAIAAIERALAQPEQGEPVAWLEPERGEKICPEVGYEVTMTDDHPRDLCWIPLYAHPPRKTENIGCLGMPVNVLVTPPHKEKNT